MQYKYFMRVLTSCILVLYMSACGFSPVYEAGSPLSSKLSDIYIAEPNTHPEYLLVRNLEERLGHNPNANLLLKHDVWVYEEDIAYGAARVQIVGQVGYHLISRDDERVIASGKVVSFAGHMPNNPLYQTSKSAATERLMQILADKLITKLIGDLG